MFVLCEHVYICAQICMFVHLNVLRVCVCVYLYVCFSVSVCVAVNKSALVLSDDSALTELRDMVRMNAQRLHRILYIEYYTGNLKTLL